MSCPYFIFKNLHSRMDMNCAINEELPDISPVERIDTITVKGRNGTLHRKYGTYDAFDYPITMQILDFKDLEEVKRWLRGSGQLILGHDPDKYFDATVVNSGNPIKFENQMDTFWQFTVTFECQPLRHRLSEFPLPLKTGKNIYENSGTEISLPLFKFQILSRQDLKIKWNGGTFTLVNPLLGPATIDCELGIAYYEDGREKRYLKSKGAYPKIYPGRNIVTISEVMNGTILLRSAYK